MPLSNVSTRIKFCGATSWEDVALAVVAGASAVGMIFADSPRRIEMKEAERIASRIAGAPIAPVAVFVDPTLDAIRRVRDIFPGIAVQLCGNETPEFSASLGVEVIKVLHIGNESSDEVEKLCEQYSGTILFDTKASGAYGGTGIPFDWSRVAPVARRRRVFVAGGLTQDNVGELVRIVKPYGVDVRSGIETNGRKDAAKMKAFVRNVRENDAA